LSSRLAIGLRALQASSRWATLAREDREAAKHELDAAVALGDVALEAEQWSLAVTVLEEAKRFGCNAVVVGKKVILNTGCERLALRGHTAA